MLNDPPLTDAIIRRDMFQRPWAGWPLNLTEYRPCEGDEPDAFLE